ncbi:hypothetical protein BH10CYA1_BH10CYA1_02350 [soil metagenome]
MTYDSKLTLNVGVELQSTQVAGVARAIVHDETKRWELTWDRFCRLQKTADWIRQSVNPAETILDVGGFDGALALFLPQFTLDVIDPETTGGTGFDITEKSYDVVVSIDALEHVDPEQRGLFLEHLAKAARSQCFINFPSPRSAPAQSLVFKLTKNTLVGDHVRWPLPNANDVGASLEKLGYQVQFVEHTSTAQWISQYLLQTFEPNVAAEASRHLLSDHLDESTNTFLYDLVIGKKS